MATALTRISETSHDKLMKLVHTIQERQKEFSEFRDRLERLDEAYAKSKINLATTGCDGNSNGETEAAIKVPIVNSEVDSLAGYLTSIFVSNTPLFPVVSEDSKPEQALQLQAIIDRDARQHAWGRQLVLFCKKAARYSIAAIEVDRIIYEDQVAASTELNSDAAPFQTEAMTATKIKDMDMYNLLFDYRVAPADVALEGEYIGYNDIISRTKLRKLIRRRTEEKIAYNVSAIRTSKMADIESYYNEPPDVSDISARSLRENEDWLSWAGIDVATKFPSSSYFFTRLYVWLAPADVGINATNPNTPRIVRLEVINNEWILSYKEMVTPMGLLPIMMVDISEEGLKYQTKSVGDKVGAYQDIATELLHSKLEGSKRAIGDRAIYDAKYLSPVDVNSKTAAAKIPLRADLRNSGDRPPLGDLYHQIPFEANSLLTTMSDLSTIMSLKDQVNGMNMAMRGEQTPGNRTLGEFNQLSSRAEGKMLPYAILMEEQGFIPMKLLIKFFILSSANLEEKVLDVASRKAYTINVAELRQVMMDFKVADGLRPKSTYHNPEALSMAIQFLQNSKEMNATYDIGDIFAEIMAVWNIDVSKHRRQNDQTMGAPVQPSSTNPGSGEAGAPNPEDRANAAVPT